MQAGGESDTPDKHNVQRALTANDWAGMQAQRGDSGIQDEENVLTALTTGYRIGMQVLAVIVTSSSCGS